MAHDAPVEKWLKENGYAFRFETNAPLARINLKEADDNPARIHRKLDNEVAYGYAQDYEKGADFPALVVQEIVGVPLWALWGGRHRIAGCGAANRTNHDMIVVIGETEAWRIDLARRVLNSIGVGKGESTNGKLHHIAELRQEYGRALSLEQLATHFRVKRTTITRYLAVIAAEERGDRMGEATWWGPGSTKVSHEMKIEAGRLTDEVMHAVIGLVKTHPADMRGDAGIDFVKKLRSMGTDRARLAAIIDRDKEIAAADDDKRTGRKRGPTSKVTRYLGHVRSIGADYPGSPEKLHLGDQGSCATLRRLRKEAVKAQDVLTDMVLEYDRLIAEAEKVEAWRAERRGRGPGASDSAPISPPP
jgi:hypothetical protein